MKFVKMHGCGNDYVYLDAVTDPSIEKLTDRPDWPEHVRNMSDRHKGIGSDGVILVCKPSEAVGGTGGSPARGEREPAHVRMRMFNADGTESEMCGNGIRCVAKLAHDRLNIRANPMLVETGRGTLSIAYRTENHKLVEATVDMGEPILEHSRIPVDSRHIKAGRAQHEWMLLNSDLPLPFVAVSMGNPHAVVFFERPLDANWLKSAKFDLREDGPVYEHHPAFPNRTNVHVVGAVRRDWASILSWERGAGMTQACGTGACAALVAGVLTNRLNREATIKVLGGELCIRWDEESNHVFMTGEAVDVFEGDWPAPLPPTGPFADRPQPTLRTARLILRPFGPSDAAELLPLIGDKRIAQMTATIPHPYEPHHAAHWLGERATQWAQGTGAVFAICTPDPAKPRGQLVGAVGLHGEFTQKRGELGYWIGVPFWGNGYATEAARALIDFGFRDLALDRIHSCHFSGNPASGRVLEKAGLRREGLARGHVLKWGERLDSVNFGLLRSDWEAQCR